MNLLKDLNIINNFFPFHAFLRRSRKKGIVRVNDRERGWKFDIVAKCPREPPVRARTQRYRTNRYCSHGDLSYRLRKVIRYNIWLSYLHVARVSGPPFSQ